MIDTNRLRGEIVAKGLTIGQVATTLGVSRNTFARWLKRGVIGSDDIEKLIEILEIKDPAAIFFVKR